MKVTFKEALAMILLAIGLFLVVGSVGNIEFADLTHTAGYTAGQFWIRAGIGVILMIVGTIVGNRAVER